MAYAIVLQTVECVVSLGFSLVSPMVLFFFFFFFFFSFSIFFFSE